MITDSELLELELLLVKRYNQYQFGKISHNETTNEIEALREDLEPLLAVYYAGRYKIINDKIIISVSLFHLIQMRYFPANDTVLIRKLK